MNIGVAPNRDGVLDDEDVRALRGFKALKDALFAHPVTKPGEKFNLVEMREDLSRGEQIDGWTLYGDTYYLTSGRAIGNKRIRILGDVGALSNVTVKVTSDGGDPQAVSVKRFFADPELLKLVQEATSTSGETDTAKWMTGGVR